MIKNIFAVKMLSWGWRWSLWLTAPLAILFTLWLALGWQRFSQIETEVLPQYNSTLTNVLEYEARQLLVGWRDKSVRWQSSFPDFIRPIQLVVSQRDIKALNSRLPQSGKRYVKGRLLESDGDIKIKMRYRGNNPRHWRGEKRSVRIRLQNDKLWRQMNTFELLAPSQQSLLGSYLGAKLAEQMGLLGPKTELVWLYLNGESRGLYLLVETIDEQTLVNNAQMPGDIYSGEVANRDAFVGADNRLFHNAGLWQKVAYNSDYPQTDTTALKLLTKWLSSPTLDHNRLKQLVDYPSFARFYLFHQLLRSTNFDRYHNWRLYFDHSRGRFFPMVWDPEGWPQQPGQVAQGRLFEALIGDEHFKKELSRQFHQLKMPHLLDELLKQTRKLIPAMKPLVDVDSYSAIDLHYYDGETFVAEAEALLGRMQSAFTLDYPLPEDEQTPQPMQLWQGEKHFSGINHIEVPVKVAPGTRILMGSGAVLIFHQKLIMAGEPGGMIEVIASEDEPFGAFVLKGRGADHSSLRYCRFTKGSRYKNPVVNYTAMLSLHEVEGVTIDHCRFADNIASDDMVHGVYADVTIKDSIFTGAVSDALDLELSSAVIDNSYFNRNGREGLDLMHSDVILRHVHFVDNLDSALSVGQKSRVRLENSLIKGSKMALLVKDSSVLRVTNSELFGNELIAELKQSNDNYADGGLLYVYRSKMYDNRRYFAVEKNSRMSVHDSYLSPRFSATKKRIRIDDATNDYEKKQAKQKMKLQKKDSELLLKLDEKVPPTILPHRGRSNGGG